MTVVPLLPNSYFDPFSVNKKVDGVVKRPISIGPGIDYHMAIHDLLTFLCTPVISGVLHY